MEWHYVQAGKPVGPVNEEEIKRLISTGVLKANDYVWNPGMGANWAFISNVPDFNAGLGAKVEPETPAVADKPHLKLSPLVKSAASPAIEAQAQALRATQEAAKTGRRRFWGYSCPECGARVHRATSDTTQRWFGVVGLLFYMAFGSFYCERCGEMRRREFPFADQVRMFFGTLSLLGFAVVLLIFLLWLVGTTSKKS